MGELEHWRIIPNHNMYMVSNLGNFFSLRTKKRLKPRLRKDGYLNMDIYNNEGKRTRNLAHRLVFTCFKGPIEKEINHIDGNKENNNISNLEDVTRGENIKHAFKSGLRSHIGEKHPRSIFKWEDVSYIRSSNDTAKQLAKKYNCSIYAIYDVRSKRVWKS